MLERFRRFNLYISLKKYKFFTIEVEFLNFVVFIKDITINKRRIEVIQK